MGSSSSAWAQQSGNPFESVSNAGEWTVGVPPGEETVATGVAAEQPVRNPEAETSTITIGAVSVNSGPHIPAEVLASSYEEFIGQEASENLLRDLASAVSSAARNEGYIFASAQIPPQSVKIGVVEVLLDAGAIDEVRIIGSRNKKLRAILERVKGPAALSPVVERQLLLAGDLPGITLLKSNYVRENDRGVLIVTVREDKAKGHIAFDNFGPETLGPIRARLDLDLAGLLSDSDVLTTNVISSILQPEELTYIYARYEIGRAHV